MYVCFCSIDWGLTKKNYIQDLTSGWDDLAGFEDAVVQDVVGSDGASKVNEHLGVSLV